MYKILLCVRYLRTRYIALASIVSVMLGVATMIVVNSVMAGFSHEMQDRIRGILSDVVFEAHSLEGFPDPDWHMAQIREAAGDDIEGMTSIVHVPAMLSFRMRGDWVTRQITLIGVDVNTHTEVSDFARFLQHPANRQALSFDLREGSYDTADHTLGEAAKMRVGMEPSGWQYRRERAAWETSMRDEAEQSPARQPPANDPFQSHLATPERTAALEAEGALALPESISDAPDQGPSGNATEESTHRPDPFAARPPAETANLFDPARQQHTGVILGIALASLRDKDGIEHFLIRPGDDVKLTLPTATSGSEPKAVSDNFTVVDFYQSKMSEYDSGFVFMPIDELQRLRGMIDPSSGIRYVTSIQIKLKPGRDANVVRDKLRAAFPPQKFPISVNTWRDKQGPLLAAVDMETMILNILLFMIIAVAGFGILATFFMIVVEKTRDIGILKSLGASGSGIMGIFLGYGLSLGTVGSVVGMLLGLLFVQHINEIAAVLGKLTGRELFDPSIYFFQQIPTIVDPLTVGWIVGGAMSIAVLASVLPAWRAALLHPVEALRYE